MKKAFVFIMVLCFAAFGGTVFVWASLNQDKTDIQLKEKVLYGDSKEADDLIFTLQANLSDRLFWKTKHVLGRKDTCETEFAADFSKDMFDESEETDSGEQKDYFRLDWGDQGGQWENDAFINQFVQENHISGWYTKTFHLQDEYSYYPVKIQLSLDKLKADSDYEATESQQKMLQQVEQELAAYFHVPIYNDTLRLAIKVEEEGHVSVCESNATCGMGEVIFSQCIVANHAIWFTFSKGDGVPEQLAKKYLSGLPEGAGVYRLPYRTEGGIPQFETDKLEQVYSISADTDFYDYVVDEAAHRILIHTEQDGEQYLTVLSSDTGTCVQKIPFETPLEEMVTFRYKDGAVLLYSSNRLAVLEEREGKYSISLDVKTDGKLQDVITSNWDFAWKDGRLAILTGDDLGVYHVFIYDRNGLLYEGKYRESLILGYTWKRPEAFFVLYDNSNMQLEWK